MSKQDNLTEVISTDKKAMNGHEMWKLKWSIIYRASMYVDKRSDHAVIYLKCFERKKKQRQHQDMTVYYLSENIYSFKVL